MTHMGLCVGASNQLGTSIGNWEMSTHGRGSVERVVLQRDGSDRKSR